MVKIEQPAVILVEIRDALILVTDLIFDLSIQFFLTKGLCKVKSKGERNRAPDLLYITTSEIKKFATEGDL